MTFAGAVAGMNYLAIVAAAVAAWLSGAIWYTVLSKPWIAARGMTMEEMQARHAAVKGTPAAWLPFVLVFIAELIIAWVLAGILAHIGAFTLRGGLISAAFVWSGFVLTTIVGNYAFHQHSVKLMAIDAGGWLVAFLVIGAILGGWGR
jgi:hypothetical protein